MTGPELREIAAKLYNLDFDTLVEAGVLAKWSDGATPDVHRGWQRFNNDPIEFILKLNDDQREALARLVTP